MVAKEEALSPGGFGEEGDGPEGTGSGQRVLGESGEMAALREQVERLEAERDALREEGVRIRADFHNFRQRMERDALRQRDLAAERSVTLLLPVLDNLDRALEASGDGEGLRQGVAMVRRLFFGALQELGVSAIDGEGTFDPSRHDAVAVVEVDDPALDGMVVETVCPGYLLGGRVLRPASVRVGSRVSPAAFESEC